MCVSLVRDPKVLRAVVSVVAGVRCKLPSTSSRHPYFLNQSIKENTDASGRPSGRHSSSSSHPARAAFKATLAQVQLNHQRIAAVVFFSSRAFCRFRSRLLAELRLGFTRPTGFPCMRGSNSAGIVPTCLSGAHRTYRPRCATVAWQLAALAGARTGQRKYARSAAGARGCGC